MYAPPVGRQGIDPLRCAALPPTAELKIHMKVQTLSQRHFHTSFSRLNPGGPPAAPALLGEGTYLPRASPLLCLIFN